ncbi:MAG: hypothetical protein HY328_18600, partial [Chloroflexi bacterium]|nr:hypothetical protein [Chloroflexota bacterium]
MKTTMLVTIFCLSLVLSACAAASPAAVTDSTTVATEAAPAATATEAPPVATATEAPPAPTATEAAPTAVVAPPVSGSGVVGGDPTFNLGVVIWQGYWLSRDHFGPFVMASGMGIPFEPPMDMIMGGVQMIAQNPNDQVMIPQNMLPLQAVYRSGSPKLVNNPMDFDPMDFEGMRLDPATFDTTVDVRGQAETMLKETQWAHNFANAHFGEVDGDFGAQQRFIGLMVNMLAQMQAQYAMQSLMGEDMLFHNSDGALDYTGNWVMLHALADLAVLSKGEVQPRYMNPDMYPMFANGAAMLFQALAERTPESAQEAAAAIRALVYLAWSADDASVGDSALAKAVAIADGQLLGLAADDVVENAAALVGLISIGAATGDVNYLAAADELYQKLAADFDPSSGVFQSKSVYSVDDVAWLIGGLNWVTQKGSEAMRGDAANQLTAFYESTLNLSGMQLSAPPGKDGAMAGDYEKNLPSELYYHPLQTPPPPMSGMLTEPAAEITWDG